MMINSQNSVKSDCHPLKNIMAMHEASPPPDHRIKKTNNQGLLTKKDEFRFHRPT